MVDLKFIVGNRHELVKNPKTSRHIPISPHLIVTRIIPEKKQNVPRKRSLLFVNDERVEKFNKENDFAPGK